jgi:hypothetical protein
MAIHLRPAVTRRLLRPTRGLGSAPLPRRRLRADGLRPPIWPCSGWSLPRFTPLADRGRRRHRHCGTGPRLTTDGRYPPPCAAELGLSSRRTPGRPGGEVRPSDRLADTSILPRPGDRPGRRAGRPERQWRAGRPGPLGRSPGDPRPAASEPGEPGEPGGARRAARSGRGSARTERSVARGWPVSRRTGGARPRRVRRPGRGRWPRWPARRRRCSGHAAHGSRSSAGTHRASRGRPPRAG